MHRRRRNRPVVNPCVTASRRNPLRRNKCVGGSWRAQCVNSPTPHLPWLVDKRGPGSALFKIRNFFLVRQISGSCHCWEDLFWNLLTLWQIWSMRWQHVLEMHNFRKRHLFLLAFSETSTIRLVKCMTHSEKCQEDWFLFSQSVLNVGRTAQGTRSPDPEHCSEWCNFQEGKPSSKGYSHGKQNLGPVVVELQGPHPQLPTIDPHPERDRQNFGWLRGRRWWDA